MITFIALLTAFWRKLFPKKKNAEVIFPIEAVKEVKVEPKEKAKSMSFSKQQLPGKLFLFNGQWLRVGKLKYKEVKTLTYEIHAR